MGCKRGEITIVCQKRGHLRPPYYRRRGFIKMLTLKRFSVSSAHGNVSSKTERGGFAEIVRIEEGNYILSSMENLLWWISGQLKRLLSIISSLVILDYALPVQVAT